MFGFSTADWIFIGFILIVIFVCIVLSNMLRSNKHDAAK
jgi:hypothetical protein